jgi:hypothetical protein
MEPLEQSLEPKLTPTQINKQYAALSKMLASEGWAIVSAALKEDTFALALSLGYDAKMDDTQMHFVRGELAAMRKMAGYPDRLKAALENEIRIMDAKAASDQAVKEADPNNPR